mgnify:CR=1 FL=1
MREITIDGKQVRVRATPLALLYYKQEFNADLLGDFMRLEAVERDPGQFDSITMMQIVWAMLRADKPKKYPSFENWLETLENFDFSDEGLWKVVAEEAAEGFFRTAGGKHKSE